MQFDIIIVGSGPAGLSLAASLGTSGLNILVLEKQSLDYIEHPKADGREIALTHYSKNILTVLGVWELINPDNISVITSAKVLDEGGKDTLDFNNSSLAELGYLVSNYQIRKALYEKVKDLKNIEILSENEVKSVENNENNENNEIIVHLSDRKLSTKLVVAADSRFSSLRRQVGINAQIRDFAKTMIVVNMSITQPHNGVALERFDYDKTIALLPMKGDKVSFVLTLDNGAANKWLALSPTDFGKKVSAVLGFEFGHMKQIGGRYSYPLVGVFANSFIAHRFALIGDAAVGMHPITAHGFNLGLRGADILARQIKSAHIHNIDIGDSYVLKRYQAKSVALSKLIYVGTNVVIDIFTGSTSAKKTIRSLAIKTANMLPPIKKAITHHLTSVEQ